MVIPPQVLLLLRIRKEEVKISTFTNALMVSLRDSKNSTRELLELTHNFSKVARYKINSNKSVAFLYSKDNQAEKEIREMTTFIIVTNNVKYHVVTLTKQVRDLYDKNFKCLKKEIEDYIRR